LFVSLLKCLLIDPSQFLCDYYDKYIIFS